MWSSGNTPDEDDGCYVRDRISNQDAKNQFYNGVHTSEEPKRVILNLYGRGHMGT